MIKAKKASLIARIERIEKELTELKQAVREFDDQAKSPKANARESRISSNYIAAKTWARKTLNLRL